MESLHLSNVKMGFVRLMSNGFTTLLSCVRLALLCCVISMRIDACDFDDLPAPSGMKLYPILDNVVHNNRVIIAKGYTSSLTTESIEGFYRREWEDRVVVIEDGPWRSITTVIKECMFTVQMERESDGANGRLVVYPPPVGSLGRVGDGLVMPSDTIVVTDTQTEDGPKRGRVSILTSTKSVREASSFYKARLTRSGWAAERDFEEQGVVVLVFRKGLDSSSIVISPTSDPNYTQILINSEEIK